MDFLFAPLEGITGYSYRLAHHEFFPGIDRYYAPFFVATYTKKMKSREKRDILPENNAGLVVVPQILSNNADEFLCSARLVADLGYPEVNLNLGCPVGTVTSKKKGSGMLRFPDELDRFLDAIFDGVKNIPVSNPSGGSSPLKVSVKTRLGWENPTEFLSLLPIFEKYPVSLLIVHARTRKELYRGDPELTSFAAAYEYLQDSFSLRVPLCYNGNLCTLEDLAFIEQRFPLLSSVMAGRGLIADPSLITRKKEPDIQKQAISSYTRAFRAFHDQLYERLALQFGSDRICINAMKEIWSHMGRSFSDSDRYVKNIQKAANRTQYEAAVRVLFANCPLCEPTRSLTKDFKEGF